MKNNEIISKSILSAIGVEVYIFLVALIMQNGEKIFGMGENLFTGVIILMLFVLSATVIGGLMVAKPILLYIDGKKKDAIGLFMTNIITLAIFTFLTGLIYALIR